MSYKKIPVSQSGKSSTKIVAQNPNRQASSQSVPGSGWFDYVLGSGFIQPSLLPSFTALSAITSNGESKTINSSNKVGGGPTLDYKQWKVDYNYKVYDNWHNDNVNYGLLTEQNGKQFWIARKVINAWYTEKFWWYDATLKSYRPFIPKEYRDPQEVFKNYGSALGEFGNQYEAVIKISVATFAGGAALSAIGVAITGRVLLNYVIEITRQITIEKKNPSTLDLADIAIESIPIRIPKWMHEWIFESLKTIIADVLTVSIEKGLEIDVNQNRLTVSLIVRNLLLKHKKETEILFDAEGVLVSEISDKIFSFITSSVIYEWFEENSNQSN